MTQQTGAGVTLKMGTETTFKTPPTDNGIVLLYEPGMSIQVDRPLTTPATITPTRNPTVPFTGFLTVDGGISVPLDAEQFFWWLDKMFDTTTTGSASPWTHEGVIGSSQKSFTAEFGFEKLATSVFQQYHGCKIASAGWTFGTDSDLLVAMTIMAASHTEASSTFDATPTSPALTKFHHHQVDLYEGGSLIGIGSNVTFNVDFGLDGTQYRIGSANNGTRGSIPEGNIAVTGSLTAAFEDMSLYTKAENGTESALKIIATVDANAIFELEVQKLKYKPTSQPIDGDQGLVGTFDFTGYYVNGAAGSAIRAKLVNTYNNA